MALQDILLRSKNFITKHSPEILTGIGISGMITSTVLAVKATPKALQLLSEAERQKEADNIYSEKEEPKEYEKLTTKEIVKTTWKVYIPSLLYGASGMTCILLANAIHNKRNGALSAAYILSEETFNRYKYNVSKAIGDKKEKEIRKETDKQIEEQKTNKVIVKSLNTKFKIIDGFSGVEIPGNKSINNIYEIVNKLNRNMNYDNYVEATTWYEELGFKNIPKCAENVGWNLDNGLIEINKESGLDDNDEPVLIINFDKAPTNEYNKFA